MWTPYRYFIESTISSVRLRQLLASLGSALKIAVPETRTVPPTRHTRPLLHIKMRRVELFPQPSPCQIVVWHCTVSFWEAHPLAHASAQVIAQVGVSFSWSGRDTISQARAFNPGRDTLRTFSKLKRIPCPLTRKYSLGKSCVAFVRLVIV